MYRPSELAAGVPNTRTYTTVQQEVSKIKTVTELSNSNSDLSTLISNYQQLTLHRHSYMRCD